MADIDITQAEADSLIAMENASSMTAIGLSRLPVSG